MNYQPSAEALTTSIPVPACPCCQQPWTSAPKIQLSLDTNCVLIKDKVYQLTAQEAEVLSVILKYAPGSASHRIIHKEVWGRRTLPETYMNLIKVHICHIRRKLRGSGFRIKTIHGGGYQLAEGTA